MFCVISQWYYCQYANCALSNSTFCLTLNQTKKAIQQHIRHLKTPLRSFLYAGTQSLKLLF